MKFHRIFIIDFITTLHVSNTLQTHIYTSHNNPELLVNNFNDVQYSSKFNESL